jgi:anti-sigma regulatory factor (Ser/Thr protein kinase)
MATLGLISALHLPADLGSLALVRAALGTSLEREGWCGDPAGRVILAASEAVANAIEHGSRQGDVVEVELALAPVAAFLRVQDAGRPGTRCPPERPAPPPLASPRGRGLIIMRGLADRFEVRDLEHGGTELRLEFLRAA